MGHHESRPLRRASQLEFRQLFVLMISNHFRAQGSTVFK
jgi:hypothetical protein